MISVRKGGEESEARTKTAHGRLENLHGDDLGTPDLDDLESPEGSFSPSYFFLSVIFP
jgi:hypothetical protein